MNNYLENKKIFESVYTFLCLHYSDLVVFKIYKKENSVTTKEFYEDEMYEDLIDCFAESILEITEDIQLTEKQLKKMYFQMTKRCFSFKNENFNELLHYAKAIVYMGERQENYLIYKKMFNNLICGQLTRYLKMKFDEFGKKKGDEYLINTIGIVDINERIDKIIDEMYF